MHFHTRIPRPPLDAFVASIWIFREDRRAHQLERILPTGAAQLIVNLKEDRTRVYDPEVPQRCVSTPGTILAGVMSHYQIIDTAEQEDVAGVTFRPGGTAAFMRRPADETRDCNTPLEFLWGRQPAVDLRDQLLDRRNPETQLDALETVLRTMFHPVGGHPAIAFALAALDQVPLATSIGAVTDAIGMSAKRFIERFKAQVGLSPKQYCRIRRFQCALARAHRGHPVNWSQVAVDCGYYDQAHFIHEFRSFSGLTPGGYQVVRTAFQNHVKFLQLEECAS